MHVILLKPLFISGPHHKLDGMCSMLFLYESQPINLFTFVLPTSKVSTKIKIEKMRASGIVLYMALGWISTFLPTLFVFSCESFRIWWKWTQSTSFNWPFAADRFFWIKGRVSLMPFQTDAHKELRCSVEQRKGLFRSQWL